MTGSKYLALSLGVLFLFSSCDRSRVFEENVNFEGESWHKDSALIFDVHIDDANAAYNLYFNCRINGQYENSNLFLFITTSMPNSNVYRDTVEYIMAEPSGKWLGKGYGSVWSYQLPYKRNFALPDTGMYTFKVEQAMRAVNLEHVLDAGIRLETN